MARLVHPLLLAAGIALLAAPAAAAGPGFVDGWRAEDPAGPSTGDIAAPHQVPSLAATPAPGGQGGAAPTLGSGTLDLGALPGEAGGSVDLGPVLGEAVQAPDPEGPPGDGGVLESSVEAADPVDADRLVTGLPDPGSVVTNAAPADAGNRTPHPTIVIRGDQGPTGFAVARDPVTGTVVPRPGSGVRGGTGTAEDPYVISGWDVAGIRIADTDAHVRIADNRIRAPNDHPAPFPEVRDQTPSATPVVLDDADNVTLAGNDIVNPDSKEVAGISARATDHLQVTHNAFSPDLRAGLALAAATDVAVENQTFRDLQAGVVADGVDGLEVRNSTFVGGVEGVSVERPDGVVVADSEARDVSIFAHLAADDERVTLASDRDARILRNDVAGAEAAIAVRGGVGVTVRDNAFTDTERGLDAEGSGGVDVLDNTFRGEKWDSFAGVAVESASELAVRGNAFRDLSFAVIIHETDFPGVEENTIRDVYGGIHAGASRNPWIDGNDVHARGFGVSLYNVTDPQAPFNDIQGTYAGFVVGDARDGYVSWATAHNTRLPFVLYDGTTGLRVSDNDITETEYGALVLDSPRNRLVDNAFDSGGVFLRGDDRQDVNQTIPPSNTLGGEPIRYVWNATDTTVTMQGGQAIVAASRNVTVEADRYEDALAGLLVARSRDVAVEGAAVVGNRVGAAVLESTDVTLDRLDGEGNDFGVGVAWSENTTLLQPAIQGGSESVGVASFEGANLTVVGGEILGSRFGFYADDTRRPTARGLQVDEASRGILLQGTRNATVADTRVNATLLDVYLAGGENATLRENALEGAGLAVRTWLDHLPGHTIPPNNTVDGDPIRYHEAPADASIASPAGQVVLLRPANVTAQGLDLEAGIEAHGGHGLRVDDSRVRGRHGLHVTDHPGLAVTDTTLESTRHGALLFDTPDARIEGNGLRDLGNATTDPVRLGLVLVGSNATVAGNALDQGLYVPHADPDLAVRNNTVEGEPLRYLEDAADVRIDGPAGQVILLDAENVTVAGRDIHDVGVGLLARGSRNVTVEATHLADGGVGLLADHTSGLEVRDTRMVGNTWGARIDDGSEATFENVLVEADATAEMGLLAEATDLAVHGSTVTGYQRGINSWFGGVNVTETNITSNGYGLYGSGGFDPIVAHGNNIVDNAEAGTTVFDGDADLTGNWWGCPEGPDDLDCDDAQGFAQVYPVLEAPNPDAGFDPVG